MLGDGGRLAVEGCESAHAPMLRMTSDTDTWETLRKIIRTQSVLTRPEGYILASGKWSPDYFDLKLTTLSEPSALSMSATLVVEKIEALERSTGREVQAVGGLTSGADPLVVAVALHAYGKGRALPGFFVRDEQKMHG